jgi:hypothetical protein
MTNVAAQRIVEQVLRNDLDPPDEDYSPYDFGASVASQVSDEVARELVRKAFELLPGTLAGSFLEGFLQNAAPDRLDLLLMEALAHAREVGAGSTVVELLQEFGGLSAEETARRLVAQLGDTRDVEQQNRLSYALWSLVRGETYDVERGELKTPHRIPLGDAIAHILATAPLTEYARTTLQECLGRTRDV